MISVVRCGTMESCLSVIATGERKEKMKKIWMLVFPAVAILATINAVANRDALSILALGACCFCYSISSATLIRALSKGRGKSR